MLTSQLPVAERVTSPLVVISAISISPLPSIVAFSPPSRLVLPREMVPLPVIPSSSPWHTSERTVASPLPSTLRLAPPRRFAALIITEPLPTDSTRRLLAARVSRSRSPLPVMRASKPCAHSTVARRISPLLRRVTSKFSDESGFSATRSPLPPCCSSSMRGSTTRRRSSG